MGPFKGTLIVQNSIFIGGAQVKRQGLILVSNLTVLLAMWALAGTIRDGFDNEIIRQLETKLCAKWSPLWVRGC